VAALRAATHLFGFEAIAQFPQHPEENTINKETDLL